MSNKKGISLVVLIIIIVLMIVLSAAIMANISKDDLVGGATEATVKNNFKVFQEELNFFCSKHFVMSDGQFRSASLDANLSSITYNTKDSNSEKNIYDVIPSLRNTEYVENVTVINGKLVLNGLDEQTNAWALATIKSTSLTFNRVAKGEIATSKSTINGLDAKYSNPIIPVGFKAIDTTDASWIDANSDGNPDGWNNGLVIQDSKGNEFVWVPVDGIQVPYAKWCTNGIRFDNVDLYDAPNDELVNGVSENAQIQNYGGFYIGRYEAGVPANQSVITGSSAESSNVAGVPQVKKGVNSWGHIDYINANTNAKSFCNNSYVKSGLMTGKMWDTTCKWFEKAEKDVDDSRTYGNYSNSEEPANVSGAGSKRTTGYCEYWKVKNIYDLAGNVWEWTNEKYGSNRLRRGGSYNHDGSVNPLSFRLSSDSTFTSYTLGFRVALYIL